MTPPKTPSPTPRRQVQAERRRLRQQAAALLDPATLRRLRLQAGYSTRRFARALGVSASTVRGLEEGANHDQLPLTFVARLAELLGVAPQELFARSTHEAVESGSDDRVVEAALQSLPGVVAVADLASALEWKLERTQTRARCPRRPAAANRCAAASQRLAAMRDQARHPAPRRRSTASAAAHRAARPRPQPHHRPAAAYRHPRRARRALVQDRIKQRTRGAAEPAQAARAPHAPRPDRDHPRARDDLRPGPRPPRAAIARSAQPRRAPARRPSRPRRPHNLSRARY